MNHICKGISVPIAFAAVKRVIKLITADKYCSAYLFVDDFGFHLNVDKYKKQKKNYFNPLNIWIRLGKTESDTV